MDKRTDHEMLQTIQRLFDAHEAHFIHLQPDEIQILMAGKNQITDKSIQAEDRNRLEDFVNNLGSTPPC